MQDNPSLQLRGIVKSFGGVKALRGVDMQIFSGEIQALCGENGAGKSTLVEILAGTISPDQGEIEVEGRTTTLRNPSQALACGIAVIHQELQLVGCLNVAENIVLGDESQRYRLLDRRGIRERASQALELLDAHHINLVNLADDLPTGQRQIVEIARALSRQAKILILDEPTAALTRGEAAHLADVLRKLRSNGLAIVLVSHHLDEVLALADRVTVLRDGLRVETWYREAIDHDQLVQAMLGRSPRIHSKTLADGGGAEASEPLMVAEGVDGETIRDVSLRIRRGEVVAMTGLAGAGQEEMARIIAGESERRAGHLWYSGKVYRPMHPAEAQRLGVVSVPADRRRRGLISALGLGRNVVLQRLPQTMRLGWLKWGQLFREAEDLCEKYQIKKDGLSQNPLTLSGGNQQKLMLARALATKPRLAILNEPTRGVDIGTREVIHQQIESLARDGLGVVVITPDTQEIERVADRVLVFRQGRLRTELVGLEISEQRILGETMGVTAESSTGE